MYLHNHKGLAATACDHPTFLQGSDNVTEYSLAYARLSSHTRKLVPTLHSKVARDSGRYESREHLPDLDLSLDQALRDIAYSHATRERSARSFEALWTKVCKSLKRCKNAFSYEMWKKSAVIKNTAAYQQLDERLAEAWARINTPPVGVTGPFSPNQTDVAEFQKLTRDRAALKPKSSSSTDDVLEVAIAYWIEAKNARVNGDDARCLHALVKCALHLGMTLSAKTEAESKSEAGAMHGAELRGTVAAIATSVMDDLQVTRTMSDPITLVGTAVEVMLRDPAYAIVMMEYDKSATNGKKVKNHFSDRLTDTLIKWATTRAYPELSRAFNSALARVAILNTPRPKAFPRILSSR